MRVFGSEGSLHLPTPFLMAREGGSTSIFLTSKGKTEEIAIKTDDYLYALEADSVGDALAQGKLESPHMPVADTLGNMAALDSWRGSAGFVYESEKNLLRLPHRQPRSPAQAGRCADDLRGHSRVELPVSRLIIGCDNQQTIAHAASIFDDFIERGGNAFDTAHIYGNNGHPERLLGRWIAQRGNRSEVVVTVKGAHTPFCTPEFLNEQFQESLDRLQTSYADIYMMHRDNLQVPVANSSTCSTNTIARAASRPLAVRTGRLERLQEAEPTPRKRGCKNSPASATTSASRAWSRPSGPAASRRRTRRS